MNLLMLNYEFPPIGGGAGQAHLNILRQYANHPELQIDVLTSAVGKGVEIEDFATNINIHRIGIRKKNLHYWLKSEVISWLFQAGRYHRKIIKENNYDLAHAFFGFPTGYLPYKTADKLPYMISLRGSDVPGYNIRLGIDYALLAGLFRKICTRPMPLSPIARDSQTWPNALPLISIYLLLPTELILINSDLPPNIKLAIRSKYSQFADSSDANELIYLSGR